MHQDIYINLPVKDLARSMDFFKGMGYTFNMQWSDEKAACLILGERLHAMLLSEAFFAGFTNKPLANAHERTEVLIALSCATRAKVDELVQLAKAQGAAVPKPAVDHGFMYQHGFHDLDGHVWELLTYEPKA
jgi:uncharacterized protein